MKRKIALVIIKIMLALPVYAVVSATTLIVYERFYPRTATLNVEIVTKSCWGDV